jgi:hypothetical protein
MLFRNLQSPDGLHKRESRHCLFTDGHYLQSFSYIRLEGLQEQVRRVNANKFAFHSVNVNSNKQKQIFALRVFKQEACPVVEKLWPCDVGVFYSCEIENSG